MKYWDGNLSVHFKNNIFYRKIIKIDLHLKISTPSTNSLIRQFHQSIPSIHFTRKMNYSLSCYQNVDAYKNRYDISRENVPQKYCIGANGFDKTLTIEEVIEHIAIPNGGNVIVKGGKNSKWYVKKVPPEILSTFNNVDMHYKKDYKSYILH